ncbi:TniQ family protein [Vibrio cyclitrophicus 1F53]|uniref:TniQ family protein n=1 Tax=Vibrio cyclitrophicus TaxID=47951 RepID=UPI0003071C38|nr:TniQ family protein [Vibrio cyclitrophicus]OEF34405.1 hypothetical protein OA7_08550 [Vibrio cyclitrophicus 1F53]OEF67076.1 hypothetical protein OAA_06550 [Vibrio cyclitrophicus 1F175]PMH33283.1 hypothetical protein BCU72_01610 [Vibrio cyclitrophicus]PMH79181.1 hypothetical protein BCU60_19855 [Vibrio cyclitrophicus]
MNNLLKPLPNEHMRSILFRIHHQSPFGTFSLTAQRFGLRKFKTTPITDLHKLDYELYSLTSHTPIILWLDHGGGNYMMPFTTKVETNEIHRFFIGKEHQFLSIHARTIHNNVWRFCSICRDNDIDMYGTSYYHQPHQVAGVFHCYKHGVELVSSCQNCDYQLSDLDRAPVPPTVCPACKHEMQKNDGYFDDFMHKIECFCLSINQQLAKFTLVDIQRNNLNYLGTSEMDINTLAFKRSVSRWNKELWLSLGKERLQRYFNNTKELGGITMSPTLKTPRYFLKDSSFKFSPPLVYILAMHATNTLPDGHVSKMD